jgi:hypothetical protein
MGQTIEISQARRVGDVLVVTTDRTLGGQEGEALTRDTPSTATFPGRLAARLFEADPAIEHVGVQSNVVSIRRAGGWDEAAAAVAEDVIARFFRYYPD